LSMRVFIAPCGLVALALFLCRCEMHSSDDASSFDDLINSRIASDDALARTTATTNVDALTSVDRKKKFIDSSKDPDGGGIDDSLYLPTGPDPNNNSLSTTFVPKPSAPPGVTPFNSPGTNFILNLRVNY
jgi:hypothetical protein